MKRFLFLLLFLLLVPNISFAINPALTSFMRVEIVQKGGVDIEGEIETLKLNVTMPQETVYQKIEEIEINYPHEFVYDETGNKFIEFNFVKPKEDIDFEIRTVVSVERRDTASLPFIDEFLKPTELIESDDPDIVELAEEITLGETTDFGKVASATKWVYENIKYDLKYAEVNNSAKKTLELGEGVCDEFSNVLIAINRALGYRSAYVVGYAYGRGYREAEDFVPHGWTEVCHGNTCFPADPTWAEAGFIDASHIEFAKISDNYFPETFVSGKGKKGSKIELKPTDTSFNILEMEEEPVIKSESELLDNELFRGYAVLRTKMETPGCALTKIESASCQLEGKEFLETQNPEELVYFCGERDFFSIFKIPPIEGGKRYNCPVSMLPSFGKQTNDTVNIVSIPERGVSPGLSVDKTSLTFGEDYSAESEGAYLFSSNGDYSEGKALWKAGSRDFKVYAYNGGLLTEQGMKVVKERPVYVEIEAPENVSLGESVNISVIVKNLLGVKREVAVRLGKEEAMRVLEPLQREEIKFGFSPKNLKDDIVQVFVETEGFSTSSSKKVNVLRRDDFQGMSAGFIDRVIEIIKDIIEMIKAYLYANM